MLGNFKSNAMQLLHKVFGGASNIVQSGGLLGLWVLDCAMGWSWQHKWLWSILCMPSMMVLLLPIVSMWHR